MLAKNRESLEYLRCPTPEGFASVPPYPGFGGHTRRRKIGLFRRSTRIGFVGDDRPASRRLSGLRSAIRPGSHMSHLIGMKTDHWDVTTPRYLQIDLV